MTLKLRCSAWLSQRIALLLFSISAQMLFASAAVMAQEYAQVNRLVDMSLERLSKLEVTSVSKSAEQVGYAAAAIYVITHDDIIRAGATSIAQALRLAPNLSITQSGSHEFVAAARGFGGSPDAQNFSNKLLILIDGRSVYSPLYSGAYLETQDVLMDDIDRIEVISGPGATLWGANAMNGVINVVTRTARMTEGALISASTGNIERAVNVRYGSDINGNGAFRVYGKAFGRSALELADGSNAEDEWSQTQGGFRFDTGLPVGALTIQGDAYRGTESQFSVEGERTIGANTLARWQHQTASSNIQVQAYYDLVERTQPVDGVGFVLHTYDIEIQQSLTSISAHKLIWGAGQRINDYHIASSPTLIFYPGSRTLSLTNIFVQDTYAINDNINLTGGLKAEDDPYYGWSLLPDLRLALKVNDRSFIWAAASRAIRSPTPFDVDVIEKIGSTVFLTGNSDFQPEKVTVYEIGYRTQASSNLSLSLSGFYNVYDNLRTIELASSTAFLPLHWGNMMEGNTYGVEAWAQLQLGDAWRLSPGFRTVHKRLRFKSGASGLLGISQAGNDATSQASLKSSWDIGSRLTIDALCRYMGALPAPSLPSYVELDTHIAWQLSNKVELSVTGQNLLHAHHLELPAPNGERIQRSVLASVRWNF